MLDNASKRLVAMYSLWWWMFNRLPESRKTTIYNQIKEKKMRNEFWRKIEWWSILTFIANSFVKKKMSTTKTELVLSANLLIQNRRIFCHLLTSICLFHWNWPCVPFLFQHSHERILIDNKMPRNKEKIRLKTSCKYFFLSNISFDINLSS